MFTSDDEYSENDDAPPLSDPPPPPPPPAAAKTYASFGYPAPAPAQSPAATGRGSNAKSPAADGGKGDGRPSRIAAGARRCVEHFMADGDAALAAAIAADTTSRRGRKGQKLDETTLQQLRAIFAANDAEGKEALDEPQLKAAIEMLGLRATTSVVAKFFARREDDLAETISLPEFVLAAADELDAAPGIEPEMLALFKLFDDGGEGIIDVGTLRHLLCDFTSPERLTPDEFDDFADCAGLTGGDGVTFDYRKYVHNMMVGKPLTTMRVP